MTLLGKIFTVSILVASLFLMFVAMVVYATHTNWKTAYAALNTQLQKEQADKDANEAKYLAQVSRLEADMQARLQEVSKVETEFQLAKTERDALKLNIQELERKKAEDLAIVSEAQLSNAELLKEVTTLRATLRENQEARDLAFGQTLRATTDLHVAAGDLQQTKERNSQLVEQVAHLEQAAREGGVNAAGEVVPHVRGLVSKSRRADGAQLIEITIGSDDGVKPQQTIEIFRGEKYLGRAEVVKADPDRAVARVLREFQQGQIQEGDDVATKLRG